MALRRSLPLFLVLIILISFAFSLLPNVTAERSYPPRPPPPGAYREIKNPNNDPEVVEMAMFAVSEHNKEFQTRLSYVKVVKGKSAVVAGMNYWLIIATTDGAATSNYETVVYDCPWEHIRKLMSFKMI